MIKAWRQPPQIFERPDPEQTISVLEWRTWMEAFVNNQLLAESKNFERQVAPILEH